MWPKGGAKIPTHIEGKPTGMSMAMELVMSLLTAARGFLAAFGCLCIVAHVVVPCLVYVGELLTYELPLELANYKLARAQQTELQALEQRLAVLKKRRARQKKQEAQRAHEDYQTQASRREEAQRRRHAQATQRRVEEEEDQHTRQREDAVREASTHAKTANTTSDTSSLPVRRPSRPLQMLSPNVPIDRRPVAAYAKASAGVTNKPSDDQERSRRAPSSKTRILSLGNIFDDTENEHAVPKPRMWAQ